MTTKHEDGLVFESARRRAIRRLATLPAEGILAYRVLYDGKAKGLFERARAASDTAAMKAVADRFLLTRYGDDAADWSASRAIDEGRFGEAASRLNDILTYVPDHDIPPERIFAKLYAAYLLMGFPQDAAQALNSYRQRIAQSGNVHDRSSKMVEGLSGDWAEKVQRRVAEVEEAGESLPRRMGPRLNPSLAGPVPWGYELTGTAADLWRRIVDFHPGDPAPIPRMELAGNGQQLFVRTPGGCVALDMEDLSPVWQTAESSLPRQVEVEDPRRRGLTTATTWRPSSPYYEDSANQISLAHGLVFTIERHGAGEFLDRDEVQAGGVLFVRPGPRTLRMVTGTRLIAYDSQTGDIRWHRGRTDDAHDVLAGVRFLSPPIAVNDHLWVSYMQGSDLHVAALRPSDGSLLMQSLIGSIREAPQGHGREQTPQPEPVAPLAHEAGTVYVPTGVGVVSALDASTMQARWTYVYDTVSGVRRRADAPLHWNASPPIVAGGVVVITATDDERILALDAATGKLRWSTTAAGCSYAIAAHHGQIWLGGQRIVCLSLADGQELWSRTLTDTTTGKAALCGDQIHVPISTGLLTLSALTGDAMAERELPASQAPLGNLACSGSSLYSLEPSSVRKFPDLAVMHETAVRRQQADPSDIGAVIQLAWSELLRGRPDAALDAVRQVSDRQASDEQGLSLRTRMSLARVKIEAILAAAQAQQSESPEEALRMLQSASSADLTPGLRLRFKTAIADQLATLGRSEEAYRLLMTLALSPDAAELSQADDGVRVVALLGLRAKIEKLREQMDAATSKKLASESRSRIAELAAGAGAESDRLSELIALSQVYEGTEGGQAALLGLAEAQWKSREYEQAEQSLLRCARDPADSKLTLEALARLATMYLESEQSSTGLIAQSLERLESHLDSNQNTPLRRSAERLLTSSENESDEVVAKLRAALTDERQALGLLAMYAEPGMERAGMSLSGRLAWTYEPPPEGEPVRMVRFEKRLPRSMADRVMIMGRDGFLECLGVERKELLWRTKLELPGRFDDSNDAGGRSQSVPRIGVSDGQTVIVNGPEGIFAVAHDRSIAVGAPSTGRWWIFRGPRRATASWRLRMDGSWLRRATDISP
jgi:outer membrane protein assembly factor BamB/predicted negative regulator of RcsB-dependent stress response